jgi:signal transduction histidine kinase/DNA-binding response OmpR family regulator
LGQRIVVDSRTSELGALGNALNRVSVRLLEQNLALREATEQAQAASLSKSQFLANMSHEIRTPMNAILGMLTLLRKTELTARQADYAAKSDGAARALLGLLNEILDFSKIEAGKMALDPHPFALDQLLRDLSVILSANVGDKPVEVLFDIDPTVPRQLIGDAMRLQQVLINLGGNAIKFTAQGEVILAVKVLRRTDDAVTLQWSMQDSGIGIAPENQARIFSGFTQAESSTTRRFGGTGLGVAISQRFVALMGGELELQSELGKGSRFYFTITLPVAASVEAGLQPSGAVRALRTLVVDDNPFARDVMAHMAQSLGWEADLADSGARALELLERRAAEGVTYQAIFVDWQMPGMDGWQTSQRIRELQARGQLADPAGKSPVLVMVTANGREMLSQRTPGEQALLDGFLVKPITASMLLDAVADAHDTGHALRLSGKGSGSASALRLQGMRLLLVEDNLNNQQVARELLQDEGAHVQVANHGREAVEALAAAPTAFDVVLMDLQMPVMDGFTATQAIRRDLGLLQLPIVAMTANAMASDRQACLDAGMDDHVGKPFDLQNLVQVLRRRAGWTDQVPDTVQTRLVVSEAVSEAAQSAQVDLPAALQRLGGKQDVYTRMLATFVRDLQAMPDQLQTHVSQGQTLESTRLLHTLKGLAATLGAQALSAQAAQAEKATLAQQDGAQALPAIAQQITEAIAQAVPSLQRLLDVLSAEPGPGAPAPSGAPVDAFAWRAALQNLAQLLEQADMEAMNAMAELEQNFAEAFGAQLEPLQVAMADMDFERALAQCRLLLLPVT